MYEEGQPYTLFRNLTLSDKKIIVSILINDEIIDDWLWGEHLNNNDNDNSIKQKEVLLKWLNTKGYNVMNFIQERQLNHKHIPSYNKMIYDIVVNAKNETSNDKEIFDDIRIEDFVQNYWKKIASELGDYIALFIHTDYFNTDDLCHIRDGVYYHNGQVPGMEFKDDLQTSADLNRDLIFNGNNTEFTDIKPDELPDEEDTYLYLPNDETLIHIDTILEKKYGYLEKYKELVKHNYVYINENGKRTIDHERFERDKNDKPHYYISILKELTLQIVWPDIDDMNSYHNYPIIGGKKSKKRSIKKRKNTNKKNKKYKRKTIRK